MATIFITGGAGYIGSHVVKRLIELKHKVIIYDNLSKGHIESVNKEALFIEGNLSDKAKINSTFKERKIDAVMHFAGYIVVSESMKDFDSYFQNNVTNSINLLEAMKENNVNKIIFSSSAAVYGEPNKIPIDENEPIKPKNPYGFTKVVFEDILNWYDQLHGIKSISLRYFNAAGADSSGEIGEDHNPETHLIPNILFVALKKNKVVEIFGTDYDTKDGTCIRDYIHVLDLADAHILAFNALNDGKETTAYNLGSEKGYSVKEILDVTKQVTGKEIQVKESERREGDSAILLASSEKIKKELGWNPTHSDIKTIVKDAWNWYKKHPDGYKETIRETKNV